ncbi:MAG: hypothetical protein ACI8QY_000775 [bacterium]|jgi:hypothetical protein
MDEKNVLFEESLIQTCKDACVPYIAREEEGRANLAELYNKSYIQFCKELLAFNGTLANIDLRDAIDKYFAEKTNSWVSATEHRYSSFKDALLEYAGASTKMSTIDKAMATKIKDKLAERDCTNHTKNNFLTFYRQFFKWAHIYDYAKATLFVDISKGF